MKLRKIIVSIIFLLSLPQFSHAAVLINEIAWMGSLDSANDEWIELHNNGDAPVVLDGWFLRDSGSLDITLTGTVGAGQFAVLERTDDDSASGPAFLIYTGALSNEGRTLTLARPDGSIEDQIAGGENWVAVGGDNVTKETAQRTLSGWVTAEGTPGKQNHVAPPLGEPVENSVESTSDVSDNQKISLVLPKTELALALLAPNIAYVNQEVSFDVVASGIGNTLIESLQYTWNFGDSYGATGKQSTHTYQFPGTYVVVVRGEYARHNTIARHTLTVLPVTFTIERGALGELYVHNTAKYEVNISGYTLRGDTPITFPENTVLLPNSTLTIAANRIEDSVQKMLALYDGRDTMVASLFPKQLTKEVTEQFVQNTPLPKVAVGQSNIIVPYSNTNQEIVAAKTEKVMDEVTPFQELPVGEQVAAVAASDPTPLRVNLVYIGLIALLSTAIVALYIRRPNEKRVE